MQKVKAEKNRGIPSIESAIISALDAVPSFTPGPWAVADSFYDRGEGDGGPRWDVHVPNAQTVADVRREADARLIAAAPMMYEACKTMAESLNGSPTNFAGMLAAHRKLDAALAKVNAPKQEK